MSCQPAAGLSFVTKVSPGALSPFSRSPENPRESIPGVREEKHRGLLLKFIFHIKTLEQRVFSTHTSIISVVISWLNCF